MKTLRIFDPITLTIITALATVLCLLLALIVHKHAHLLATGTPVTAVVAKVWTEPRRSKGGAIEGYDYVARLIFDRKEPHGSTLHCDVPRVMIGATAPAPAITVVPQPDSCWEPYVTCEACVQPTNNIAWGFVIAAIVSGLAFFLLVRKAVRDNRQAA